MSPVLIIAEAGVNHNGSIKTARNMVEAAHEAGADYIKFQTFKADNIVSKYSEKAEYQKNTTDREESQYQMLKRLELSFEDHIDLKQFCDKLGIGFLSTPFDIESILFLHQLGLDIIKIPSGEITNLPYLRTIGKLNKTVFMSTGMSTMIEVENALNVLINTGTPKNSITIMHANTEYPTPYCDINLRALQTIRDRLHVKVGYSDHSPGIEIPVAAVAMGASVIEKHFSLNKKQSGPDHQASLNPAELKLMIKYIRNTELALGNVIKQPTESEIKNIPVVRKSITASREILKGEILTDKNITTKRPGTGISPMEWDSIAGTRAIKNFAKDDLIVIK